MALLKGVSSQADLIGAEFQDPSAAPEQPLHEQLAATLSSRGITSKHGPEHFQNTVRRSPQLPLHVPSILLRRTVEALLHSCSITCLP